MTIEEEVYALLSGDAGVLALVPVERIKPPGGNQKLARPYVVHFPVAPSPEYMYSGRIPLTEWEYQVSCFADSYSEARDLSSAIVSALNGQHGDAFFMWTGQTQQYEADVLVNHIALSFTVYEAL